MDKLTSKIINKTGSLGSVSKALTPISKQLQKMLNIIRKHQKIEEQLREKSERLDMALKSAKLGTWCYHINEDRVLLDKYAAKLMGLPAEKIESKSGNIIQLCHPDDRLRLREEFNRCEREKNGIDMEFRSVWSNGEIHNLVIRGNLYTNTSQGIYKIIGVVWDITEHKQNRENLNLRLIAIDASHNMIIITDNNGVVEYANPAVTKCTGYAREEIIGKRTSILKSGKQNNDFYKQLWDTILTGEIWQGEMINKRKDGTLYPEEMTITPVKDKNGNIVRFIAIKRDISERKKAEQARLEQKHLQEAVKSMEQVLSVVSHELRTPLAALRITSEFLMTDSARQSEEFDTFIKSIHSETIHMAEMVNNLLDATRLNNGTVQWNWQSEININEICQQVMETVKPLVNTDIIELKLNLPQEDIKMNGDAEAIKRLLINLLGNAAKYTSEGYIKLNAQKLYKDNKEWIELQIQDTGTGIDKNIAKKLGRPFALGAGLLGPDNIKGAGLGLTISKSIAAAHGGYIKLNSEIDRGSTFTVILRKDLNQPAQTDKNIVIIRGKKE